jgi:hypothetical protein
MQREEAVGQDYRKNVRQERYPGSRRQLQLLVIAMLRLALAPEIVERSWGEESKTQRLRHG